MAKIEISVRKKPTRYLADKSLKILVFYLLSFVRIKVLFNPHPCGLWSRSRSLVVNILHLQYNPM